MKRLLCCCILVGIMVLSACAGGEDSDPTEQPSPTPTATYAPTPTPTPVPTTTPTPTAVPDPYEGLNGLNPLTGLPMDEAYENRRPAAVMLNNLKKALPMYGVNQADIIYEVLIEGGTTRMLGVYQNPSQVPQIGTVRSTRAYYLDLAQGHDAILLHVGYSEEAREEIKKRGVTTLNLLGGYENTLYWRDQERIRTRGLEHSAFTSGERIEETFQKLKSRITHEPGFRQGLLFKNDGTPQGGESALSIIIRYSSYKTGSFDYDAQTGTYAVSQFDEPYIDGQDNTQVSVVNVLILRAPIKEQGDKAGHLSVNLVGAGDGLFACGGQVIPIQWSKKSHADPFTYALEDGTPLALGRGHSYINIVSLKCPVTIE